MGKERANSAKIRREEADLKCILQNTPANPIPWLSVIRVVAPIIARLAVRYALKKLKRDMSEDKVNAIGTAVATLIRTAVTPPVNTDKSKAGK